MPNRPITLPICGIKGVRSRSPTLRLVPRLVSRGIPCSRRHAPTPCARASLSRGRPGVPNRRRRGGSRSWSSSFFSSLRLHHGHDGRPGVPARVQRGHVLRLVGVAGLVREPPRLSFVFCGGLLLSCCHASSDAGGACDVGGLSRGLHSRRATPGGPREEEVTAGHRVVQSARLTGRARRPADGHRGRPLSTGPVTHGVASVRCDEVPDD